MLTENKKFSITYILLVIIAILNILELKSGETELRAAILSDDSQISGHRSTTDDPSFRQPGGYHYGRVKMLALAGQERIDIGNPNLDIEKCKEAYLAYYSRQSEEEAQKALITMHSCER